MPTAKKTPAAKPRKPAKAKKTDGNKSRIQLGRNKSPFTKFAQHTASWSGSPSAFILALATVAIWLITGPVFDYSDTWQLVINTGTTIVTFLMVFLIQNTQNRDTKAMQLKLDELIRATDGAHTVMLNLEQLSSDELEKICEKYASIAEHARARLRRGLSDTDIPDVILDGNILA
jgi:low affinity Fe/Cu permease